GFIWSSGTYTPINVPGATNTYIYAIADDGEVGGSYDLGNGISHGFLYKGGSFFTYDAPTAISTVVQAVSGTGEIAGYYTDATGQHAFATDMIAPAAVVFGNLVSNMDGSATIAGTSEANATVTLFDGASSIGTTTAAGNGAWSFTTTGGLANAVHVFTATATDAAGNVGPVAATAQLGSSNADTLTGTSGNDWLFGRGGNDTLNGGAGTETAVYQAALGSYFVGQYNGEIAVLTAGSDGHDRLFNVEALKFADQTITAQQVASFDPYKYIASYSDLTAVFHANAQAGFDHFIDWGYAEGRT